MSARFLFDLILQTIRQPREGAETVLALGVPRSALWEITALVVVLSVLLGHLTNMIIAAQTGMSLDGLMFNPLGLGAVQLGLLVGLIYAIYFAGRAMGGTGTIDETILLVAWLQFIMVALQVVQTLALVVIPPFASLIGVAGVLLFMWLLTHFVAVIHGFTSLGRVFFMIIMIMFGLALIFSIALSMLGVDLAGTV